MPDIPVQRARTIIYELVTSRLFGDDDVYRDRLRGLCVETSQGELVAVNVMDEMVAGILAREPREELILKIMTERLKADPHWRPEDSTG